MYPSGQQMYAGAVLGAASGYAGDCSPKTIAEQRQAEIPHQFERLERTLKGCLQGLETLGARLEGSVMRSEPPSPVGNGASAPTACPSTPYGSRLQEMTSVAAIINERIQSLSARLEV